MKKKVLLPFLWLAACCMLLVTIVPHHHHIDGRICLQLSEIPENGQNRDITHRPDCETDCLARFAAYRTSTGNPDLQSNIFIALLSISDRTKRNVQRCLFLIKTFAFLNTKASLPDYELHPI